MLDKTIPFYGKYNSINSINYNEENNTYYVKRYDYNGLIKEETFEIPNNKKNISLLKADYYNDVSEYLIKNKEKYNIYKDKKLSINKDVDKKFINKTNKLLKILLIIGTCLVGTSFYLTSLPLLIYLATGILATSSVCLLMLSDLNKEVNIKNFINDYEEFEYALKEYRTSINNKDKKSLTEYNGLNKDKNKGNDLNLRKIKVPEKSVA